LETAPDATLVRAARRGDQEAFAQLVRRYLRRGMAVAFEYAEAREDAEDVLQDTFVRVWRGLERFDPERGPFAPWFFTVLRNTARNAARHRGLRTHGAVPPGQAAATDTPYEALRRRELREQIEAAVRTLPPMRRSCFRLCVVEGLSGAEAADALGIAESTVRVHVFKARQTLRDLLEAWREEAGGS